MALAEIEVSSESETELGVVSEAPAPPSTAPAPVPTASAPVPTASAPGSSATAPVSTAPAPVSLLDRLKCPARSELSRKRKSEKSTGNKRHKSGVANPTDPKTVTPSTRVKEFPGEHLAVRKGKLFCTACREELALKKSTVKTHISVGDKHQRAKKKLEFKESKDRDLTDLLKAYDQEVQPTVSMEERVYRARVVEEFLLAGIPLMKIDSLRGLLEENAVRLTHSSHLANYIPPLLKREKQIIREEIQDQAVSVVFDGTSRLGEALAIVIRFCSGWSIKQKLVRMSMLAKSLSGEEVAREVLTVLSTELGISGDNLVAVMRDRASVNNVAVSNLLIMYPWIIDIGCFSHTINNAGDKFEVPTLNKFMKHWEQMFKHSYKSRLLWREKTGRSIVTYSPTRWWSKWECERQVLELFGDVPTFIGESSDVAPKSKKKLEQLLLTSPKELIVELAAVVDAGEPFVKATYKLEGDGPLALECYEILSSLKAAIQVSHLPNTTAVAKRLASPTTPEQHWMTYAMSCIQPVYDYFNSKFNNELLPVVNAFKSARLFLPAKINDLKPDGSMVDALRAFKFLDRDEIMKDLKSELPSYLALAEDLAMDIEPLDWWERNADKLPCWSAACRKVVLCQPSSACVERVFSLLKHFTEQQQCALEDYIEVALMMQYNKK